MRTFGLVLAIVGGIIFLISYAMAWYSLGRRRGLAAPLTARQKAITADVRRRTNGHSVATVRRRSADYNRPQKGNVSRKKG